MMAVLNYRLSLQRDQSRAKQMSTTGLVNLSSLALGGVAIPADSTVEKGPEYDE